MGLGGGQWGVGLCHPARCSEIALLRTRWRFCGMSRQDCAEKGGECCSGGGRAGIKHKEPELQKNGVGGAASKTCAGNGECAAAPRILGVPSLPPLSFLPSRWTFS